MKNIVMEKHIERLRDFFYENRNSEIFDSATDLYKAFIKVQKDGKQKKFNQYTFTELLYLCMHRYNRTHGLQSLVNLELPFEIGRNLDFEKFCLEMRKYLNIQYPNNVVKNDNYRDLCVRGICMAIGHDSFGGWSFLDYQIMETSLKLLKNNTKKLYVSVDNKDLHFFAIQLIKKSDEFKVNYDFKINADDRYRRADNVVIYCSDLDVKKYITMIDAIKLENPQIDFGYTHLLSSPINEYIGIADIEKKGSIESHSFELCKKIVNIRNEATDFEDFFKDVRKILF